MTHSLHRRGSSASLANDYVILVTPAVGFNDEGAPDKLREALEVVLEAGPANIGSYATGTVFAGATPEEIRKGLWEQPRVRCAFAGREQVKRVLEELKKKDLGLSVTVSGLTDEVLDLAREVGLKPHSINLSLGVWGNTAALPSEDVLEFVTMCGHGLISRYLVEKAIDLVRRGRRTPEQAARMIAPPCVCGIFNPVRAAELFRKYVPAGGREEQE
ncbi:MAG: hypothetical protein H5U04_02390 [Firmicutes bacterium]|nr:hypothetical protein [Bacillota bacterium]